MVKYTSRRNHRNHNNRHNNNSGDNLKKNNNSYNGNHTKAHTQRKKTNRYDRLADISKQSVNITNSLFNPIDAINRFVNLALQSVEEDSQSRQFLLESKSGIRRMSALLKRLNNYNKRIEKEISRMTVKDG